MFCPKMYQGVTHRGSLLNKEFITTEFLRGIIAFEKHLGPVFVQVSDAFTAKRKEELFTFLRSLPTDMQFFLEVRHSDWFGKETVRDELFAFLRSINMGIVITDTSGGAIVRICILPCLKLLFAMWETVYTKPIIQGWMNGYSG